MNKLEEQIGMLTDIRDSYDTKVAELKELGAGKTDEVAVRDQ